MQDECVRFADVQDIHDVAHDHLGHGSRRDVKSDMARQHVLEAAYFVIFQEKPTPSADAVPFIDRDAEQLSDEPIILPQGLKATERFH